MEEQTTIALSLPLSMVREIDRLAKEEQITRNDVLKSALGQYFRSHEIWEQIFAQGERWAEELGIKNEEDVDKLIHEFRREQATAKSGF